MSDLLKGLDAIAKGPNIPPVEKWNPPYCGEIDIKVTRDGTWFYLGTPIGRAELVRLFSSILWRDGDDYFLVTPVEKVKITVEDAPLFAIDFEEIGDDLHFITKTGDKMIAGVDHPIEFKETSSDTPSPYILVRRNLWALIDRKSYYRLVDLGVMEGEHFGVKSMGEFFPMIAKSKLEI